MGSNWNMKEAKLFKQDIAIQAILYILERMGQKLRRDIGGISWLCVVAYCTEWSYQRS